MKPKAIHLVIRGISIGQIRPQDYFTPEEWADPEITKRVSIETQPPVK